MSITVTAEWIDQAEAAGYMTSEEANRWRAETTPDVVKDALVRRVQDKMAETSVKAERPD
jgi:quinol monooxygenase YgiN